MTIQRIDRLNINSREVFTAIYGEGINDEGCFFIDNDLKLFNLTETLYRSLKDEGYETILFYDNDKHCFSYSQEDIERYLNVSLNPQQNTAAPRTAHRKAPRGPLGSFRTSPKNEQENRPNNVAIKIGSSNTNHRYYFTLARGFDLLEQFMRSPKKNAIVFCKTYKQIDALESTPNIKEAFDYLFGNTLNSVESSIKIILLYPYKNDIEFVNGLNHDNKGGIFYDIAFRNKFTNNGKVIPATTCRITFPECDEIKNILHRRRITEPELNLFHPIKFDKIVRAISGNNLSISELLKINIKATIDKLANKHSGLDKLNKLIGLTCVKDTILNLGDTLMIDRERNDILGTNAEPKYKLNFVFTGNPGTGKTTVARLLGEVLCDLDLLWSSDVVECTRDNIVAQYVGHTAKNVTALFDQAIGKVLFIDEIYSLYNGEGDTFGKEAQDTIVGNLTNPKYDGNMAVVIAGYKEDTEAFMSKNPGMNSRFNYQIEFPDYSNEELVVILKKMATGFIFAEGCDKLALDWFDKHTGVKTANGRLCENLLGEIKASQTRRLKSLSKEGRKPILFNIEPEDYPNYLSESEVDTRPASDRLNDMIGLDCMKQAVRKIMTSIKGAYRRGKSADVNLGFVFMGNPGTGKTTVARFMGEILCEIGAIQTPDVIEVTRSGLVAGYSGQTALKVDKLFDSAIGKVLFIDEVYSICSGEHDDFGKEALSSIVANLTKPKYMGKMATIIAGYPEDTQKFIDINPGMDRRLPNKIVFTDYSNEELREIFIKKGAERGFVIETGAQDILLGCFQSIDRGKNFGNAAVAENLLSRSIANLDLRIETTYAEDEEVEEDVLNTITRDDILGYDTVNDTEYRNESFSIVDNDLSSLDIAIDCSHTNFCTNVSETAFAIGLLSGNAGVGTGFVISSEGHIITAYHVVENNKNITFKPSSDWAEKLSTTEEIPTRLIWHNASIDIAILKSEQKLEYVKPFRLSTDKNSYKRNSEIILSGYPNGTEINYDFFTESGNITSYARQKNIGQGRVFDTIFTNLNATHGCSGGPVCDRSMGAVGVLHGGTEGQAYNTVICSDIRQLFKQENLTITYIEDKIADIIDLADSTIEDQEIQDVANAVNPDIKKVEIETKREQESGFAHSSELLSDHNSANINSANKVSNMDSSLSNNSVVPCEIKHKESYSLLAEDVDFPHFNYCIIDTNIWMDTTNLVLTQQRIRTLAYINSSRRKLGFDEKLFVHGHTYEELERMKKHGEANIENKKPFGKINFCASKGLWLLNNMLRLGYICAENLNATPDNEAYADPEIIKTAKLIYRSNKTVLILSNDQGLSGRLFGSLNDGLKSIAGISAICFNGYLQTIDRQFTEKLDYYYSEYKQDVDLFLTPLKIGEKPKQNETI